ncbi:MAG: type II toxin-antitoxin system RelE/ParE family toxin [Pirellulales bacterium]|nr:type II toxin-antitoxin system RelE/ParE family toxin [Pirellulales bacterium]
MAYAVRTPAAEQDLQEIALFIAVEQARPLAAERVVENLVAKCNEYAAHPLIGEARPDLGLNIRCFPAQRWIVVYRPTSEGIEVMRILDAARDYPALFDDR